MRSKPPYDVKFSLKSTIHTETMTTVSGAADHSNAIGRKSCQVYIETLLQKRQQVLGRVDSDAVICY